MLLAAAALAGIAPALAADSPVGQWNTVDEKTGKVRSTVDVYDQGGKIFARIVSLTDPNDEQGRPRTCTKCQGEDKNKPVVGLVIIKDLSASGERYKGGTILDPEDGKVYKAEIWVENGKLKVRGYLGMFYRTQTWAKAK
ncbi:MAG TPA: DUF2147 domain-containing protein [Candidatus Bathyarchaeia archaeon]|nr:DUF2147 domain-containing protein [Candidatus Bathyarchaeia archaeon]